MQEKDFALMSDNELVEGLMAVPKNDKLHKYFFQEKCKHFLTYISNTLYNGINGSDLVGELYEFLSDDNWKVLRMWRGKNGCSLNSYLSSCSLRYFTSKVKAEQKRCAFEVLPSTPEVIELLNHFTAEEEAEMPPVWEAYNMLNERDRVILRLLVIEGKRMLDAAPEIYSYMSTPYNADEMSQKSVQSNIAMAKHRAIFALANKLNVLRNN